jgi:hypothetical protein
MGRTLRGRPRRRAGVLSVVSGVAALALAGCNVPSSMHVTRGVEPRYEDDDVRFRTTYYFRVFDLCEEATPGASTFGVPNDGTKVFADARGRPLRMLKDSLYRFRMTGKSASLFNKVHFESGTLKAHQIDPFGANVAYDEGNGRYYFRSQQETQADAQRESRMRAVQRYLDEARGLGTLPASALTEVQNDMVALARGELRLLQERNGTLAAPPAAPDGLAKANKDMEEALAAAKIAVDEAVTAQKQTSIDSTSMAVRGVALERRKALMPKLPPASSAVGTIRQSADTVTTALFDVLVAEADEVDNAAEAAVAAAKGALKKADEDLAKATPDKKAALDAAQKSAKAATDKAEAEQKTANTKTKAVRDAAKAGKTMGAAASNEICPPDSARRRGFQVLGPEGLRTFDQDDRLIMAMTSDAKPLIGMLQDLSNRVLTPKLGGSSDQLLPVVTERLRIIESRRVAETASPTAPPDDALKTLRGMIEAFDGKKGQPQ